MLLPGTRRAAAAALLAWAALSPLVKGEARPSGPAICHECFWSYGLPEEREELAAQYRKLDCPDAFCRAEVSYLLARLQAEPARVADAYAHYRVALDDARDDRSRLLITQDLALTAKEAGRDPAVHFRAAAALAEQQGQAWQGRLLRDLAGGTASPQFGAAVLDPHLEVPDGVRAFVLGRSRIAVPRGARVGVQVERTVRDWLSRRLDWNPAQVNPPLEAVLDYHEGARLRDLMKMAGAVPVVLAGTYAAWRDGQWYAPDEDGIFRFPVLRDKVEYPTTKQAGPIAFLTDTHGVSALVEQAVRERVHLVIACGDNPGKVQAAAWLTGRGIHVYCPCDREAGRVLGHHGKAVLLGTAPIRKTAEGAVVGDQPVRFSLAERIVVQDIDHARDGVWRYYDTPARYFRSFATFTPLNLQFVAVDGVKQTGKVIEAARQAGAQAVAVRVEYEEDYQPLAAWLEESAKNRAVLFHSAPYPAGYRLFAEFPKQVTFGDPHPEFLRD